MARRLVPLLPLLLPLTAGCPPEGATTTDEPTTGDASTGELETNPTTGDEPPPVTTGTTAELDTTGPGSETTMLGLGDTEPGTSSGGTTGDGTTSTDDGTTTGDGTTSTGTSTGDGTTSTGDDTTGDGTTSTGDDTTGDDTTGDDTTGDTGGAPLCCEAGCTSVLLQSHEGSVTVLHAGAAIATHDAKKNLALWGAADLGARRIEAGVARAALVGDRLVFERAGELHVVDAADGATLAVCPADVAWGLARDAGYLWTAGAGGLQVRELDCAPRWAVAGALADAKVLATADALHVFDADLAPQAVTRLDADDGAASSLPFLGSFGQWFADVPRFWTVQGDSHRLYDEDGALLNLGTGKPVYGWGARFVLGETVRDIAAPAVALATLTSNTKFSGPAALAQDPIDSSVALVRLDLDPVPVTPVDPGCCVGVFAAWSFAFADGAWAVGGAGGLAMDHLGRFVTPGEVVALAGSAAGRAAVGLGSGEVRVFDVEDDCGVVAHPPFFREDPSGGPLWMSNDGGRLLSRERWAANGQGLARPGTRFYALPDGALLAGHLSELSSDAILDHDVADDGSLWSRTRGNLGIAYWIVAGFPPAAPLHADEGDVVPKIAPDGQHVVTSDGDKGGIFDDWTGDQSYVFDPSDLVAVFPGIAHGFLDDARVLVGHYQGAQFLGSEIVDLDGAVVQATTLPEIHRFWRVGTGEILAIVQPSGDAAIFDPVTGAQLWAAPAGAKVALAGPDAVVVSRQGRVELVRWR